MSASSGIHAKVGRPLIVALAATLVASCVVGPDFRSPHAPSAAAYTNEPLNELTAGGTQFDTGKNPAEDWWKLFGSPELDAIIERALANNRSLAASRATLEQAQEIVRARSGSRYPQVSLDAAVGRQKYGAQFSGAQDFPPFAYFTIGPNVSYLLDYTGGERRAVEREQAQADYQAYQLQAAYLGITGNVAVQALAAASAQAQIDTVQALLSEDQQNVQLVRAAFDAGSGTRVDLLSAESQLANDQTLLPPLRQDLSVAQHALAVLIGETPADRAPAEFKLDTLQVPTNLPLSLPSELVHRRPDILAAEAQLHAATADIGVATSRLYPQITLTGGVSQQSTELAHLFDRASTAFSLGAGVTQPIFDGGTLRAERRATEHATRAALARYEQTVLESFGQVADVLTALEHDAEQLTAQQRACESSQSSLDLTRESYRVGNVGILQVLDAERLYQQARRGYVRAQAQRYQDTVQLFLALGGGDPLDRAVQQRPAQEKVVAEPASEFARR